jgi:hypothetical protein
MARVVRSRREGNRIYYLAQDAHVRRLVEEAFSHVDHVVHGLPDHVEPQPKGARRRRA